MKRFIAAASFVLAVLFLFNSCTLFETPRAPSDTQAENGRPATGPAVTDPAATQPPATETEPAPYIPLSELYPDAIAFSDLKTSKNSVRYADWRRGVPSGE